MHALRCWYYDYMIIIMIMIKYGYTWKYCMRFSTEWMPMHAQGWYYVYDYDYD